MPSGTRAPKELLHHLPALVLRRPSVSACPPGGWGVMRGSRLLDLRPPRYRCPAVPGLTTSARAILMAPGSSVHPLVIDHLPNGYCVLLVMRTASMACRSATFRQPAPSPYLHVLWVGTPLPNLPVRASAADAFTEVLLTELRCWVPRTALAGPATAVLLVAAPDHCGPPGTVVSPVAVLHQPWLRNSTTAPSCVLRLAGPAARQFVSAGPCCLLGYERNHNHAAARCLLPPP